MAPTSIALSLAGLLFSLSVQAGDLRFIQIQARNVTERSAVADLGVSIEAVRSDSVWAFADPRSIERVEKSGFKILGNFSQETARGGHETSFGFPDGDERFHTYPQMMDALNALARQYPNLVRVSSIGKSLEGRDMLAIHINTSPEDLEKGMSSKPGVIYMGNHHAREHVSAEIPLMLAEYLLKNSGDAKLGALLANRDIWILPMINPDGVEHDIATTRYQYWRKNRRDNGDGSFGVDLNRNYGYKWGSGGSSQDTGSEVYMGKEPFSEPETVNVREFVKNHLNAKVLLSFHTFSELILYPWGHKYAEVENTRDHAVFEKMAQTMAQWNHYTPEQASKLYIASGDTTDWAYGTYGIFAFTFELSPSSQWGGGFYPGAKIIDKVFADNLRPTLYLLETASDPYSVLTDQPTGFLKNYVQPRPL